MERFTISLDDELAAQFDQFVNQRGYSNRSEAVRDMIRRELVSDRLARPDSPYCVAALAYVFDHHERRLAERLTELQHDVHDLVVSSMHVHLNHHDCLETTVLKGLTSQVAAFAEKMMAESGVRHAQLNLIPVDEHHTHDHDHDHDHHGHEH